LSAAVEKKLLIVDDNESLLLALEHNLRQAGYSVIKACDGREALSAARQQKPDIIVSDVGMPEMDGIEFCRRLREIDEFAETPFVFLTAHGETEEKVLGLRSGGDDYIVKPFDMEELVARLDGLFEKKKSRRQVQQLSGRLSEISISDVLQFLDLAQKEGTLCVSNDGKKGEISIKAGLLMGSSYGPDTGEDALVELLQLTDGFFHFEPKDIPPDGLEQPIGFAVMETMRLIDERTVSIGLLPEATQKLALRKNPAESDGEVESVCAVLAAGPNSLTQLEGRTPLSHTRLAIAVAKLLKEGCLEVLEERGIREAATAEEFLSPDPAPPSMDLDSVDFEPDGAPDGPLSPAAEEPQPAEPRAEPIPLRPESASPPPEPVPPPPVKPRAAPIPLRPTPLRRVAEPRPEPTLPPPAPEPPPVRARAAPIPLRPTQLRPASAAEAYPGPPPASEQPRGFRPRAEPIPLRPTPLRGAAAPAPEASRPRQAEKEAASGRTVKVLFAFTDEEEALRVLAQIAGAFRSDPPKGFKKGSVDFQRIKLPEEVMHLFSVRGERRLAFLWEPLLATSDASMFLVKNVQDLEELAFFRKRLDATRKIPLVVVSTESTGLAQEDTHVIQTRADVLSLVDELIKPKGTKGEGSGK